jgi:hypothetical protein
MPLIQVRIFAEGHELRAEHGIAYSFYVSSCATPPYLEQQKIWACPLSSKRNRRCTEVYGSAQSLRTEVGGKVYYEAVLT